MNKVWRGRALCMVVMWYGNEIGYMIEQEQGFVMNHYESKHIPTTKE